MLENEQNGFELKAWNTFPALYVDEVSAGNKTYRFFAEDMVAGSPVVIEHLPLEFFNHELLRVDTTSEQNLLRFCEKWGLVFSPLYPSKAHALSARTGRSYNYPQSYRDGIEAVRVSLAKDIEAFRGSCGFNEMSPAVDQLIGSEFAREAIARGDYERHLGAAVSVNEVAYTVRLLQLATTMQAAYTSGLHGRELSLYLLDNRVVPRRHPIDLEERDGMDLFFSNRLTAAGLYGEQDLPADTQTEASNAITWKQRNQAIDEIALELAIENCRTFTSQATINLALENLGVKEILSQHVLETDNPAFSMGVTQNEGSLVEAILANFNYVMHANYEWLTCEHCGRVFKFQKEYDPTNRYRKSTFCSNSCRVMNAQRAKTEEAKTN